MAPWKTRQLILTFDSLVTGQVPRRDLCDSRNSAMTEAVRQAPSPKTFRQLYVLSGNQCANPRCTTVLINANGTLVADVCHIKAEKPGGPRFDKKLSPERRRAPANLILLCSTCHKLVDREPQKYTVAVLTKWKRDREDRFAAVGDTLRQRYVGEIVDEAELEEFTLPLTLKRYKHFLNDNRFFSSIDNSTFENIESYVDRLRHIARSDRELMRAIIEKGIALGGRRETEGGIDVHPDDLKTINKDNRRLSDYRIAKLGRTLDRNSLGGMDVDEEPRLQISAPDEDLAWSTVKDFLEADGKTLRDVICDLKFGLLD
jgi:HNH endonuclease